MDCFFGIAEAIKKAREAYTETLSIVLRELLPKVVDQVRQ